MCWQWRPLHPLLVFPVKRSLCCLFSLWFGDNCGLAVRHIWGGGKMHNAVSCFSCICWHTWLCWTAEYNIYGRSYGVHIRSNAHWHTQGVCIAQCCAMFLWYLEDNLVGKCTCTHMMGLNQGWTRKLFFSRGGAGQGWARPKIYGAGQGTPPLPSV